MKYDFRLINSIIKKILSFFIASSFFLLFTNTTFPQTKNQVEGVWKIVQEVDPKGDTIINGSPQPSLLIFTTRYYSFVIVTAEQSRGAVSPAKDRNSLTDAEKIARYEQWKPFAANAGVYEINGSKFTARPIVAKSVDMMNRQTPITWEFKLEGTNTLWLIPMGQSSTEPKIKLTRLE